MGSFFHLRTNRYRYVPGIYMLPRIAKHGIIR